MGWGMGLVFLVSNKKLREFEFLASIQTIKNFRSAQLDLVSYDPSNNLRPALSSIEFNRIFIPMIIINGSGQIPGPDVK